jgi:hypothetical protein
LNWPLDRLRAIFRAYADVDFPTSGAPLYAAIADRLAGDDDLLAIAANVRDGQPPPNLLFAAVHCLLLSADSHPLAAYYPDLTPEPLPAAEAFPHFQDFCIQHRAKIADLIQTHLVQTNVLERSGLLLPAFATAAEALATTEVAVMEIGASAGLNLLWDRYHYHYGITPWGDPSSSVHIHVETRGERPLPLLPHALRSVWRKGIDLDPVDLSDHRALLWQRALIWPERIDRQERLQAAREIMLAEPVHIVEGDATQLLPALLAEAPPHVPLIVFASYTLYQFPKEARTRVVDLVAGHARMRPTVLITLGTNRMGQPHGTLELTHFDGSSPRTDVLAHAHPHGLWIEWLA